MFAGVSLSSHMPKRVRRRRWDSEKKDRSIIASLVIHRFGLGRSIVLQSNCLRHFC